MINFNKEKFLAIYNGQPNQAQAGRVYDALYEAFKSMPCKICGSMGRPSPLVMAVALAQVRTEVGRPFLPIREVITPAQANKNYGGRYGNTLPDDGYRYRGANFLQHTFKNNWKEVGLTEANCLDLNAGAKALVIYFRNRDVDTYATLGEFKKCREIVNGVNPKTGLPNGYETYMSVLNQYLA